MNNLERAFQARDVWEDKVAWTKVGGQWSGWIRDFYSVSSVDQQDECHRGACRSADSQLHPRPAQTESLH